MLHRSRFVPALVAALVLLSVIALAVPAAAFAAKSTGPATWSAASPADGGQADTLLPPVSVRVYDPKVLSGPPYVSIKVDGVLQTAKFAYDTVGTLVDKTRGTISWTPRSNLGPGNHTIWVSARNNQGTYSTYQWSFSITSGPRLSQPLPTPGTVITTTSPTIQVSVTNPGTGVVAHVYVDGTEVPSIYTGIVQLIVATPTLTDDATHDVRVTVSNAANLSDTLSWSFKIQVYADMPVSLTACTDCHAGFPALHPMTDCVGCHGPNSPVGDGWNTPQYSAHSSSYISGFECGYCHGAYSSVPPLHTSGDFHQTTAAGCTSNSSCHEHISSLTREHYRRTDASGNPLTCATCHESTDPLVRKAIADRNTDCSACHPFGSGGHPYIQSAHVSNVAANTISGTYPDGKPYPALRCDACHLTELAPEHARQSSSSAVAACDNCHPSPRNTLNPWQKGCVQGGCHAEGTPSAQHGNMTAKHVPPSADAACIECHENDLTQIHSTATTTTAGVTRSSCTLCHGTDSMPSSGDCQTCHAGKFDANGGVVPHGYDPTQHTAAPTRSSITIGGVAYGPYDCSDCHTLELYPEHTKNTSSSQATKCKTCHPSPWDSLTPSWTKGCAQGNCHAGSSTDPQHGAADIAHQRQSANDQCATASGCHTKDLAAIHVNGSTVVGGKTRTSCQLCHADGVPQSGNCLSCHADKVDSGGSVVSHGYTASRHTASVGPSAISINGHTYGPIACTDCHTLELGPEHKKASSSTSGADCTACHPNPRSSFTTWGKTCTQGNCHAGSSPDPQHGQIDANHQRLSANDQCAASGCHTSDLSYIHSGASTTGSGGQPLTSCQVCHAAGIPASQNCLTCHPDKVDSNGNVIDHGYDPAKHVANISSMVASGVQSPYAYADGAQMSYSQACTQCHLTNLYDEHQKYSATATQGCGLCHGPGRPYGSLGGPWNKTCQQGACHSGSLHADFATKHAPTPGYVPGSPNACSGTQRCHTGPVSPGMDTWGAMDAAAAHNYYWYHSWVIQWATYPWLIPQTPSNGCVICHSGPQTVPTATNCATSGCHNFTTWSHP